MTRPMLGFKSFEAAQSTLPGIALLHMITKRQRVIEAESEDLATAAPFYAPAISSPPPTRTAHLYTKICDRDHMLLGSITTREKCIYRATFWPMCSWIYKRPHVGLEGSQALA